MLQFDWFFVFGSALMPDQFLTIPAEFREGRTLSSRSRVAFTIHKHLASNSKTDVPYDIPINRAVLPEHVGGYEHEEEQFCDALRR